MKQTALFIIGLTIVAFPAAGGGLNRIGGMGPRHGALSGSYADDSALFCYNPAGLANFQRSYADLSVEVFTPHFRLKNRLTGRSNASAQNVYHLIPLAGVIEPVNDHWVWGVGITTPYGFGAKFDSDWLSGIYESETLLGLVNLTPAVAFKLTDNLSLGVGLNIGYGQFKYRAPFDIQGWETPIKSDSEGDGWGLGAIAGLNYRPTPKLEIGISYLSEMKVRLSGETKINDPTSLFELTDRFDSAFTFPDRLSGTIAYHGRRTLVAFSANWYGYSQQVNSLTLDFEKLPLTKTTILDWRDNYSLHLGARLNINHCWSTSFGLGYQTAAIPPQTISQYTPDADGWDLAWGLNFSRGSFHCQLHAIYGWGEMETRTRKYSAQTWTIGAGIGWLF
ncbi:MAG TPA: outer membrane protein transport protein [bacterium]|nr:outer membrane protein transport protein [bacterium]HNS33932.1 outer membrane protein transport protein [bacterium]HNW09088.1 outer membrane protein transport protein [bacterium]HNZ73420.1 outer membrane protein transport protein [bacterium]HOH67309.1 outer membrane protein transport protein [bacterium]